VEDNFAITIAELHYGGGDGPLFVDRPWGSDPGRRVWWVTIPHLREPNYDTRADAARAYCKHFNLDG
jgi:hypothetical protein